VNVALGPREDRLLITGLHTVCDIHCTTCNSVLGWKYEVAYEESQKYKEGKYIIEKAKVMKVSALRRQYHTSGDCGM
jgi:Yippee zinc-binding/DNA-binding /Mis18, centromere assembly